MTTLVSDLPILGEAVTDELSVLNGSDDTNNLEDLNQDENENSKDESEDSTEEVISIFDCLACNAVFNCREQLDSHVSTHLKKPKIVITRVQIPAENPESNSCARKRIRPYINLNKNLISQVIEPDLNPNDPNYPAVPKLRILLPSQLSQQVDDQLEKSKSQTSQKDDSSGTSQDSLRRRPSSTSSTGSNNHKSDMVESSILHDSQSPKFPSESPVQPDISHQTDLTNNFWGQDNESHTSSDSGIQIRESGEKEVERHDTLLQNFLNDTVNTKDPGMILPGPIDTEFISLDRLAGPQCVVCCERFVDKASFQIHCKATGHFNPPTSSHNSLVPYGQNSMISNPLESLSNLPMQQLAQQVNRLHQNGPVQQNVLINIQQFGHQPMPPHRSQYEMPPHMQHPMYASQNSMYHPMGHQMGPQMGPQMGQQMGPHGPQMGQYHPPPPMYYPGGNTWVPPVPPQQPPQQHQMPRPSRPPPPYEQGSMMPPRPPPPRMPMTQQRPQAAPPIRAAAPPRPPPPRQMPPRPAGPRGRGAPMMRAGPPVNIRGQSVHQQRPSGPQGPTKITLMKRTNQTQPNIEQKKKRLDFLIPDTNDDADCHVISMQKCNDGLPVIKNVQGATSTTSDPIVHLTDSITLSVRNPKETPKENPQPQKKNDAKAVANILATRGITVTPATKPQKEAQNSPSSQKQSAPVAINLNSAVSIIPTAKNQNQNQPVKNGTDRTPTVDLTDDESSPHVKSSPQNMKRSLPYTCDLCPAQYPSMKTLMTHRRQYHKAGPHGELGIPIVDLSHTAVLAKLQSLGIHNYIPLPQSGTNGTFGLPIVSVNGAKNPNVCNLGALGSGAVLTLGPLHHLSNAPGNTKL